MGLLPHTKNRKCFVFKKKIHGFCKVNVIIIFSATQNVEVLSKIVGFIGTQIHIAMEKPRRH